MLLKANIPEWAYRTLAGIAERQKSPLAEVICTTITYAYGSSRQIHGPTLGPTRGVDIQFGQIFCEELSRECEIQQRALQEYLGALASSAEAMAEAEDYFRRQALVRSQVDLILEDEVA